MQSSSLNPITPAVWGQTLQQAVDSRHGRQPHQYIVRDSNGTLSVTANPRTDQHKLTIREIVDETRASLRESAQKKQFLEDPQIDVVANNIKTYTKELIDARAEKGIHNGLRMTAKFFSAIGCLALVGIPFYRALVKGDREFKAQADALKAEVESKLLPVEKASPQPISSIGEATVQNPNRRPELLSTALALQQQFELLGTRLREQMQALKTEKNNKEELELAIAETKEMQGALRAQIVAHSKMINAIDRASPEMLHLQEGVVDNQGASSRTDESVSPEAPNSQEDTVDESISSSSSAETVSPEALLKEVMEKWKADRATLRSNFDVAAALLKGAKETLTMQEALLKNPEHDEGLESAIIDQEKLVASFQARLEGAYYELEKFEGNRPPILIGKWIE